MKAVEDEFESMTTYSRDVITPCQSLHEIECANEV
jgi:hypothetical protein